jgi:hypothetical protein
VEELEILNGIMDATVQGDAVAAFTVTERLLHVAEEAARSRDSKGHRPQFAQDFVPAIQGGSFLVRWYRQ